MVQNLPPRLISEFNRNWEKNTGAIDGLDLLFLHGLIAETRPRDVIEIGCCTGLSTAFLALLLDMYGGARVTSVDLNERVYFDPSKKVGYLIEEIAAETKTEVRLMLNMTALDAAISNRGEVFDFAFVDASHQHPWPVLDTLFLLPVLQDGALVAHHDLQLYRGARNPHGVGPKILFDQLSGPHVRTAGRVLGRNVETELKTRAINNNIFAIDTKAGKGTIASRISQALYLPWSTTQPLEQDFAERTIEYLSEHYHAGVRRAFEIGLERDRLRRSQ